MFWEFASELNFNFFNDIALESIKRNIIIIENIEGEQKKSER